MAATSMSEVSNLPSTLPTSLPALRWDAEFAIENGRGVFLRADTEYRFEGLLGETIRTVISCLDGRKTPSAIAQLLNLPEVTVRALIEQLQTYDLAVMLPYELSRDLAPEQFTSICRHYFPLWKERLFSHPL